VTGRSEEREIGEHWRQRLENWANRPDSTPSSNECCDTSDMNGRMFALSSIRNSSDGTRTNLTTPERLDFESRLEDPFHVRQHDDGNSSVELCSGLLDLVRDIDEPFTESVHFRNESGASQRHCDNLFDGSSQNQHNSRPLDMSFCMHGSRNVDIWSPDQQSINRTTSLEGTFVPFEDDSHDSRDSDEDLDQRYVEQILQRCRARSDTQEGVGVEARSPLGPRHQAGSRRSNCSREGSGESTTTSVLEVSHYTPCEQRCEAQVQTIK